MRIFKKANFKDKVKFSKKSDEIKIEFYGKLTYKENYKNLLYIKKESEKVPKVILDFQNLENIDYAIAFFLKSLILEQKAEIQNSSDNIDKILDIFNEEYMLNFPQEERESSNFFYETGQAFFQSFKNFLTFCQFLGLFLIKFFFLLFHPKYFRLKETSNYIKSAGIDALFIVCLTSFLLGFVLAYIGALMLAKFGAGIYIVEVMGVLALREISPLIAAIVVAGRSASSFTAEIGVMKLTEEIDAMKTMGFDPFYFLIMPRIIALVLFMPIIIFLADLANIFGQMIISYIVLNIDFSLYLEQFQSSVSINHFLVGIIKAPFYGLVISNIACLRGLEVDDNSASIGKLTTRSVVNSIFSVIAVDAVAAIIFEQLGF